MEEITLVVEECAHDTAYRHRKTHPDCACYRCQDYMPRPLPLASSGAGSDERPVCEPPIFEYSSWIGDTYQKKREAVMKCTSDDKVATTHFMDIDTEVALLGTYHDWARDSSDEAKMEGDKRKFYEELKEELFLDRKGVNEEWLMLPVSLWWDDEEGKWVAKKILPWSDGFVDPTTSSQCGNAPSERIEGHQKGNFPGALMTKHDFEDEREEIYYAERQAKRDRRRRRIELERLELAMLADNASATEVEQETPHPMPMLPDAATWVDKGGSCADDEPQSLANAVDHLQANNLLSLWW